LLCIGVAPFWLFVFAFTKNLPIGAAPFNLFLHNYNDITQTKVRTISLGIVNAMSGGIDYSEGSYFWEHDHYLDPNNTLYRRNGMFARLGWGTTNGTRSGNITFEVITTHNNCHFMNYNPNISGNVWP
jgi:hypothetical protein